MQPVLPPRTKCALCGNESKLCKSHVIPKFAYKPAIEDGGAAILKTTFESDRTQKLQTGFFEPLLCSGCEAKIGKWDDYARRVLFGRISSLRVAKISKSPVAHVYAGLDYKLLKLFQMSVLWRASVAKNRFFAQVDLGPRESILRDMIWSENPGEASDFGCAMARYA